MGKFCERLRGLRKEQGLTQREMASVCEIKPRTYQDYEYDKSYPTVAGLIFLADFFNVSTDYLLGRTDCREVKRTTP